jgi:DNA-binding MarR family transcriptional regulator
MILSQNRQMVETYMLTARMKRYIPLIQEFAGRLIMLHSAAAEFLGLHVTDIRALRLLAVGPMTAGALGEGLGITGAATTALIDRLERAGYAVRERETLDRRKITIHAVPEKLAELDNAYNGVQARMTKHLSKYTAAEFSAIADYLEQTARIAGEEAANLLRQNRSQSVVNVRRSTAG